MATIGALGEREIISLAVDQTHYTGQGIKDVTPPTEWAPYWEIRLTDGTIVLATGNVNIHFR